MSVNTLRAASWVGRWTKKVQGVRSEWDPDDIKQEALYGIFIAERECPGDRAHGRNRARQRIGRHIRRECRGWELRTSLPDREWPGLARYDRTEEIILIREILDLVPFAVRDEVLFALLSNDGKRLKKAGRLVRESVPGIEKEGDGS